VSRAPAENVTGEVTVAPLAGEQIKTVLSTVAVHTAEATFAEAKRKVATRKTRSDITRAPFQKKKLKTKNPAYGPKGVT
jgi:hypothetical protein